MTTVPVDNRGEPKENPKKMNGQQVPKEKTNQTTRKGTNKKENENNQTTIKQQDCEQEQPKTVLCDSGAHTDAPGGSTGFPCFVVISAGAFMHIALTL